MCFGACLELVWRFKQIHVYISSSRVKLNFAPLDFTTKTLVKSKDDYDMSIKIIVCGMK